VVKCDELKLACAEDLETIRGKYTTDVVVKRWFDTFRSIVDGVEPDEIWRWDEMTLIADHRGKMVMPRSKKVLRQVEGKVPHVTYIAGFTAVGPMAPGIPPTLVLPAIQRETVEKEFAKLIESGAVNVDASANGWVTKDVYRRFGMRFIDFVERRRREDVAGWRGKKAVVIVDNCSVHAPIELLRAFRDADDTSISLPPHLTHGMQGVDVVHAKSFREKMPHSITVVGAHLEDAFDLLGLAFDSAGDWQKLRVKMVFAAVDAARQSTTYSLCSAAFRKS
jgi:hypothetical protein